MGTVHGCVNKGLNSKKCEMFSCQHTQTHTQPNEHQHHTTTYTKTPPTHTTPPRRNGNATATQQRPECMGLGPLPVCRIVRIMQTSSRRCLCKRNATLNEAGLCPLREMKESVWLTLKSVAGALIVGRGSVVCPSLQCGVLLCCVVSVWRWCGSVCLRVRVTARINRPSFDPSVSV